MSEVFLTMIPIESYIYHRNDMMWKSVRTLLKRKNSKMDKLSMIESIEMKAIEGEDEFYSLTRNMVVYSGKDFMAMLVKGRDESYHLIDDRVIMFHINPKEECFIQIKGDIVLKVIIQDQVKDIIISEGSIYVLDRYTPHCPIRPLDTLGLVIECTRDGLPDEIGWYCSKCFSLVKSSARIINNDLGHSWNKFIQEERKEIFGLYCKTCNLSPH
jgi:3-hydroxyanthranilate 3,4-dioxygenase